MSPRTALCAAALAALAVLFGAAPGAGAAETDPPPAQPHLRQPEAEPPDPAPVIELYTMGEGELLVERFGHAAMCVRFPGRPMDDVCYNYGTTDFARPLKLGWGFLRGGAEFWVSLDTPRRMIHHYRAKDRSIWVQRLPLDPEQAWQVAEALEVGSLPENRYYQYHHFFDNCTTRLRDIIDDISGGALRDGSPGPGPSFREFGRAGLAEYTLIQVIADFALGRSADRPPTLWEAMFLPQYLRAEVEARLGARPVLIYERRGPPLPSQPGAYGWWIVLLALIAATPAVLTRVAGRFERLGLLASTGLTSVIGAILWLVALISPLPELRFNEALLVFLPTDVLVAFMGPARRVQYGRARVVMLAASSLFLAVGLFRQPLWLPLLVAVPPMLVAALPRRGGPAAAASSAADETVPSASAEAAEAGGHDLREDERGEGEPDERPPGQ